MATKVDNLNELNLIQKLSKIRSIVDVVKKEKSGFNYKYSDILEILAKVKLGMEKHHISLFPLIVPGTIKIEPVVISKTKVEKTTKEIYEDKRTEMLYTADFVFRWVNDDKPEEILDVPWSIVGSQEDPSQAFGSALTYCTRYFLTEFFQIGQADTDVDEYRSKQKEAEMKEDAAIAAEITKEIDLLAQKYVEKSKDKDKAKQAILEVTKKYIKSGNYLKIEDSKLAAKLLKELNELCKEATK